MEHVEKMPLIDLGILPRIQNKRNFGKIDWDHVIGMELQFKHEDIAGKIIFVDRYRNKMLIKRIIYGYEYIKEVWITFGALRKGVFSRSLFSEIAFTRPDLLQYFVNKEDAYRLVKTSNKVVLCKCPVCGYIKPCVISHLNSKYGFICNKCSDKSLSYPNKFMLNFLDQVKCEYFSEASKSLEGLEWLNGYRYDFLAITQNGKYFIEMDGHFHKYNNTLNGTTAEEQQTIDRYKDNLAKQYGYQVIRIDCCYKSNEDRHTFIKNNIINSEVMNIFNISEDDIDWDECDQYALSNTLHIICDYWNAGNHDVMDIVKQLRLSWSCIHFNLLKGAELGLCDYDSGVSKKEKIKREKEKHGMPCIVLKDGVIVGVFETGRELSRQSVEKFGHYFNPGHISYVCTGRVKTCFGYNIQRISRKQYEEILATIQN